MGRHEAWGVLVIHTHEVTTAHTPEDIEVVSTAYSEALTEVSLGLERGDLLGRLECEPIRPLFQVRARERRSSHFPLACCGPAAHSNSDSCP